MNTVTWAEARQGFKKEYKFKQAQEFFLGVIVGAAIVHVLSKKSISPPSMPPGNKTPLPSSPSSLPQSRISWYPRRSYVADVRPTYLMPAWYAA